MKTLRITHDGLLIQDDNWNTHVCIKPIEGDSEGNRIDFGNYNELSDDVAEKLLTSLSGKIKNLDALIISQHFPNGVHLSKPFQNGLQKIIPANKGKLFLLDSRSCSDLYQNTIRKLNSYEASKLCA